MPVLTPKSSGSATHLFVSVSHVSGLRAQWSCALHHDVYIPLWLWRVLAHGDNYFGLSDSGHVLVLSFVTGIASKFLKDRQCWVRVEADVRRLTVKKAFLCILLARIMVVQCVRYNNAITPQWNTSLFPLSSTYTAYNPFTFLVIPGFDILPQINVRPRMTGNVYASPPGIEIHWSWWSCMSYRLED